MDNRYSSIQFDVEKRTKRETQQVKRNAHHDADVTQVQHLASKGLVNTDKAKAEHRQSSNTALPSSVATPASTSATSVTGGKNKGTMNSFFKVRG